MLCPPAILPRCRNVVFKDSQHPSQGWCHDFLHSGGATGHDGSCCKADGQIYYGWCKQVRRSCMAGRPALPLGTCRGRSLGRCCRPICLWESRQACCPCPPAVMRRRAAEQTPCGRWPATPPPRCLAARPWWWRAAGGAGRRRPDALLPPRAEQRPAGRAAAGQPWASAFPTILLRCRLPLRPAGCSRGM